MGFVDCRIVEQFCTISDLSISLCYLGRNRRLQD